MDEIDLSVGRELCAAATLEPWCEDLEEPMHIVSGNPCEPDSRLVAYCNNIDDIRFIVYAREALPAALDEIERLRNIKQCFGLTMNAVDAAHSKLGLEVGTWQERCQALIDWARQADGDDSVPVTEEWCKSIGFKEDDEGNTCLGPMEWYNFTAGAELLIDGAPGGDYRLYTRGQVRMLCKALGLPIKEQTAEKPKPDDTPRDCAVKLMREQLTLRDYMASCTLIGLASGGGYPTDLANDAYKIADEMLKARENGA